MKGEVKLEEGSSKVPKEKEVDHLDSSPLLSRRSKNHDIEADSASSCRICLEDDDKLISPCLCKGTQQFVHRSCLDHWRSVKEGFDFSHCTTCKAQFHLRIESSENCWRKFKFRFFVTRDVLLVFLALQTAIAAMGAFAYLIDKNGSLRNMFVDGWYPILSKHPIPFYYCIGVVTLLVLLGFFGLILQCLALLSSTDVDCPNCGYIGCCYVDCSGEGIVILGIVCVIAFAILGIFYGLLVATMTIQKIWQKHYHILTKRKLTEVYIVEDMHGSYTPPELDWLHEERLKMLKLL